MHGLAEINTKNFARICGLNGMTADEVARKIKKHRTTLWKAVKEPHRFKPTFQRICQVLPIRNLPR